MIMVKVVVCAGLGVAVAASAGGPAEQQPPTSGGRSGLTRDYREGATVTYRMKTSNRGRTDTLEYTITATGIVKRGPDGRFFEEVGWSDMIVGGKPFALPAASQSFRQRLTLEPNPNYNQIPDLSQVHPILIGPITDLLTFYADMLVARQGALTRAGDHFYFPHGRPASWADGRHVTLGQDSIDFDVTLTSLDQAAGTAVLLVRHVPPPQPQIEIPVEWMRQPVADTPNNWVQVSAASGGKVAAGVGKETFDVTITIGLVDGRILSATIENPVQVMSRDCDDATLSRCASPTRYQILRHVEITSTP